VLQPITVIVFNYVITDKYIVDSLYVSAMGISFGLGIIYSPNTK